MTSYIYSDNLFDPARVSSITTSSAKAQFPASNLYNGSRRSKLWRSNGYYEVKAGENTITFQETSSVDLIATVTVGEYTSFSDFALAVKTALDNAGASTYTVTQDTSTLKIKITSDGSGGGGIFSIMWTSSTNMAYMMGYSYTTDDTGFLTYTADNLRLTTGEFILVDMGLEANPDAVALIARRNSNMIFTSSSKIRIEGNTTNIWNVPQYTAYCTITDDIVYKTKESSADGLYTQPLRYWRFFFEDLDSPTGYIEIGSVFIGNPLTMARGRVQIPFTGSHIDASITVFSEGGQSFSDEKEISESFEVNMFGLTITEKEEFDQFFHEYKTVRPFFIQFDPNSAIGSDPGKYFRFVRMASAPTWNVPFPGVYEVDFTVREEL